MKLLGIKLRSPDLLLMEEMISNAKVIIAKLFASGHPVVVAYSGGKDSTQVANLVLTAARQSVAEGFKPFVVVTTGSTLVENPEVDVHFRSELRKMQAYGVKHGFEVITKVVTPNLSSTWQVNVLSGRSLPSFAGTQAACSVDMKVNPQKALRRRLFKDLSLNNYAEPVICIGTRFDESSRRSERMTERGESASTPVRNKDGELILSPIAFWTTDDVWEAIGMASNGLIDSFSDFEEVKRIYAHAENTSCAVVADSIGTGKKRGGCGTRTGCVVCLQAEDKSLENMVAFDPRYTYAQGLVKYNKFLRATRHDWSLRHWIGRTIKGGYIAVRPDTYHPKMLRNLFRYMLQLDYDEAQRAAAKKVEPMFQLLSLEMMVAIDARWSLNGLAKPFSVWADYRDIYLRGIRYDIPEVPVVASTPMPESRYLFVGSEWADENIAQCSGMRDVYYEALTEGSSCGMDIRETKNGRFIWDFPTDKSFNVNSESAEMLLGFELESMLAKHDAGHPAGSVTAAYKYYIQYGALTLTPTQLLSNDEILVRTSYKDVLGLSYEYDTQSLLDRAVGFSEMPESSQNQWSKIKVVDAPLISYVADINAELERADL